MGHRYEDTVSDSDTGEIIEKTVMAAFQVIEENDVCTHSPYQIQRA